MLGRARQGWPRADDARHAASAVGPYDGPARRAAGPQVRSPMPYIEDDVTHGWDRDPEDEPEAEDLPAGVCALCGLIYEECEC